MTMDYEGAARGGITGGDAPPKAPAIRTDAQGYDYYWDGYAWRPMLNPVTGEHFRSEIPRTSAGGGGTSSSYNVSDVGPVSAGLQQQNIDLQMQQQLQQYELGLQKLQQDASQFNTQQSYLGEKLRLETDLGNRAEVRATQALMEQIQSRIETNALAQQRMIADAQQLQAQFNFQASQANAQAQMQAQQINEQRRAANLEQRRGVANDIASYSRNPGDVGANASYLLAGGAPAGPAAISQAIVSGQDARTAQSLLPLDLLLSSRDELAKGPTPFMPSTVTAPTVPIPTFQSPTRPQLALPGQQAAVAPQPQPASIDYGAQFGIPTNNPSGTQLANTGYLPAGVDENGNLRFVAAANGFFGTVDQPTMFLAGEGGSPETVSIQPRTSEPQPITGMQPSGAPAPEQPSASLSFLNTAFQRALGNSPWAKSGVPTPVGVSAPGTSPFLQQMAAALAALGRGINPGLFMNEAQMAAPVGLSGAPTRRTR